jgi:peptidoglycan/LPS O-acetylase OafA/YrhL
MIEVLAASTYFRSGQTLFNAKHPNLGNIAALDGLRGIAIVLVMMHHARLPFWSGGFLGVDIFFTLSGFLITYGLLRSYETYGTIKIRYFFIRRVMRLVPALFVMLVLLNLFILLFMPMWIEQIFGDSLITFAYLSNWAHAFRIRQMPMLIHTWSLANEEQFYLLLPFVLLFLLRLRMVGFRLIAVILGIGFVSWAWSSYLVATDISPMNIGIMRVYYGFDTRIYEMMIGAALAVFVGMGQRTANLKAIQQRSQIDGWTVVAFVALSAILFLSWRSGLWEPRTYYLIMIGVNALTALLILYILKFRTGHITRLLSFGPLVFIGRISYGLYLWHVVVYQMFRFNTEAFSTPILILATAVSLVIAVISYYIIERPLMRLKSRYELAPTELREVEA